MPAKNGAQGAQGAQEHAIFARRWPPSAPGDPFFEKVKPPRTSISSQKRSQTFENQASRPQFNQKMTPKFKNR